jgi:hypothetical protein
MLQPMDILNMLTELRQQREQIVEAMAVLQRIAYGRGKRRGTPPSWMTAAGRVRVKGSVGRWGARISRRRGEG